MNVYKNHNLFGLCKKGLAAIVAIFVLTGCDSTGISEDRPSVSDMMPGDLISSVAVSPVFEDGQDEPAHYLLQIAINPELQNVELPESINLLGYGEAGESVLVSDSGMEGDRWKGDGLFSARVDKPCAPVDPVLLAAAKNGADIDIGFECDITFVPPGEECLNYGVCPERQERSFLWGLIEYEVDVVVCFCVGECTIKFG